MEGKPVLFLSPRKLFFTEFNGIVMVLEQGGIVEQYCSG